MFDTTLSLGYSNLAAPNWVAGISLSNPRAQERSQVALFLRPKSSFGGRYRGAKARGSLGRKANPIASATHLISLNGGGSQLPEGYTMNTQTSLVSQDQSITMSSLEISKLTDKNHRNVLRDIRATLEQAGIDPLKFEQNETYANNRKRTVYQLPRMECDLVISGYSVKYRWAIIQRWHELEQQPALPNQNTISIDLATLDGMKKIVYEFDSTGVSYGRWVMTQSDGHFTIRKFSQGEVLIAVEKLAGYVGDSMGGMIPYKYLHDILVAASQRIKNATKYSNMAGM